MNDKNNLQVSTFCFRLSVSCPSMDRLVTHENTDPDDSHFSKQIYAETHTQQQTNPDRLLDLLNKNDTNFHLSDSITCKSQIKSENFIQDATFCTTTTSPLLNINPACNTTSECEDQSNLLNNNEAPCRLDTNAPVLDNELNVISNCDVISNVSDCNSNQESVQLDQTDIVTLDVFEATHSDVCLSSNQTLNEEQKYEIKDIQHSDKQKITFLESSSTSDEDCSQVKEFPHEESVSELTEVFSDCDETESPVNHSSGGASVFRKRSSFMSSLSTASFYSSVSDETDASMDSDSFSPQVYGGGDNLYTWHHNK